MFLIISSPAGNFQINPRNTHPRFGRESSDTLNASNRSLLCLRIPTCKPYNMANVRSGSHTVTCTPHFKNDADRPWITQEGVGIISISLHPKSDITLEDAAKLIENFASRQVSDQLATQPGTIRKQ